jgi:hypothetical protein
MKSYIYTNTNSVVMIKLFKNLLIVFVILGNVIAYAQTNVGGTLSANTTWSISGSPYILTNSVGVPAGITLTIQPGVQVSGAFDLLVKGTLICIGKSDSLIKISSTRLLFKSALLTNSQLSFINFSNSSGIQLADEGEFNEDPIKNSGDLTIDNSVFVSSAFARTKGYQSTASLIINNSQFLNAAILGYYPRSEPIVLTNCKIDNSTVNSDAYNYGIGLDSCIVTSTNFLIGCCSANISIENSKIIYSNFNNGMGNPVEGPLNINKTLFYKSSINLPSAHFSIKHSIFVNDDLQSTPCITLGNGIIDSSFFIGNVTSTSIILTGRYGYNVGGASEINYCTFSNHQDAITVLDIYSLLIDNCNLNLIGGYCLKNNSSKNINAQNNWWGTTNISAISNSIYDASDNINLGQVDYSNLLNSLNTIAPITPPSYAVKRKITGGVEFKWKPNSEADLSGYKIYYGSSTGYSFSNFINAGNVVSYVMLSASIADTFAVTAYDNGAVGTNDQIMGRESWFSNFEVASINNLDTIYCSNASSVNLVATPAGGVYSGAGISGNVFNPSIAGAGKHKVLYIYPSPSGTNDTVSVTVNVNTAPIGGSLNATANTICIGDSVDLTLSGYSGSIQWQLSVNGTTWNNISGAISSAYHTGALTSTKYYRAVLSNGVCTPIYSNVATIVVNPISHAGTVSANKTEICIGDNAALALLGYTGSIQWQSSSDSLVWTNISGANAAGYNTGAISIKMYYRAIVTSGICSSDTSVVRSVKVNMLPTISITPVNATSFCSGGSTLLNAVANSNCTYEWQMNNSGISGANLSTYTATQTGNYSVKATDTKTSCSNVSSQVNINSITLSLQPTSICIVGVDSATGKNFIVWEKSLTKTINSFYIYKETSTSNVYAKIGEVGYNSFSAFIDTTSDPRMQSDRYKISILDSCGVETSQSSLHKTIHLNINQGSGNTWNLIWNDYEGFSVSNYRIYRGTSSTNMSLIGTTTAGSTSFSDFSAPSGFVYYQVEVTSPSPCKPSRAGNYVSSKSNIASNSANSIIDYSNLFSNIEVYPIPNSGVFTVAFYSNVKEMGEMKIVDMLGGIVFEEKNISITSGKQSKVINLEEVAEGVYFLHFQSKGDNFKKMIIVKK